MGNAAQEPRARRWPRRLIMLVTDRKRCGSRTLVQVVADAIDGGVNAVQLREKDLPAGELLKLARQLRGVCGDRALLFINDRVDVALLSGADGVQLSEDGLPVAAVRRLLPASMRVGKSVHSFNGAREAEQDGADFVVAGTVFPSASHPEGEAAGVQLIRDVVSRVNIPVFAIGGITPENEAECFAAGASGVAVISAILDSDTPRLAAERFVQFAGED